VEPTVIATGGIESTKRGGFRNFEIEPALFVERKIGEFFWTAIRVNAFGRFHEKDARNVDETDPLGFGEGERVGVWVEHGRVTGSVGGHQKVEGIERAYA
jgi:hypothetical protein